MSIKYYFPYCIIISYKTSWLSQGTLYLYFNFYIKIINIMLVSLVLFMQYISIYNFFIIKIPVKKTEKGS